MESLEIWGPNGRALLQSQPATEENHSEITPLASSYPL